jgi:hypothetical protein
MAFYSTEEHYDYSMEIKTRPTMIKARFPQENSQSASLTSPPSFVSISSHGSTVEDTASSNRNWSASRQEQPLTRKPKRMLTAYNFFFHHHRQLILAGIPEEGNTPGKAQGKVGFKALAQMISARWKAITVEEKAHFQACSDQDRIRHSEAMKIWKKQQEEEAARLRQQEAYKRAKDSAPLLTFCDVNHASQRDQSRLEDAIACVDMSPQESQKLALALGEDGVSFLVRAFC